MRKSILEEVKAMNSIAGTQLTKEQEIALIKQRLNEISAGQIKKEKVTNASIKAKKHPENFTLDPAYRMDDIVVQRIGGSEKWVVAINGEYAGRIDGAQSPERAIYKARRMK